MDTLKDDGEFGSINAVNNEKMNIEIFGRVHFKFHVGSTKIIDKCVLSYLARCGEYLVSSEELFFGKKIFFWNYKYIG